MTRAALRPIPLLILALSLVYALAMFRGLENHPGYYGCAYQALTPGSFPADPFMAPGRPVMVSLYYGLVKWVGPLWLDDRFTLAVFFLMTLLSLVCLDKTARLLGIHRPAERAAVLSLVLVEHQFFITHILLVDNYGFNGTALGGAVALWLLYAVLAAKRLPLIVLLIGLCAAVSMKNTWLPILMALFLLWKERLTPRAKTVGLAVAVFLALAAGFHYYTSMRPVRGTDAALFDYILNTMDDLEAHPFWYPVWCNLFFAGFCSTIFFLRAERGTPLWRVKVIAAIGLGIWLLGGLYLSFAPEILKIPYLVPFDVQRALRWPCYVVFTALAVRFIKRLQENAPLLRSWVLCWIGLMALYLLHVEFRTKLALCVAGVTAFGVWRYAGGNPNRLQPDQRLRITSVSLVLGTLSLYGVGAIHHRWADLRYLQRTGILGDNPCAKWVGMNEYIRENTPPSAVIAAFSLEGTLRNPAPLNFDGSLRTRTGRSMPMGHRASFYFDYEKLLWCDERDRLMKELCSCWEAGDAGAVSAALHRLGPPDYLVMPARESTWVSGAAGFPYQVETTINGFALFHKTGREAGR